jgi:zinc D-Ala-D-Ala carboxypeptidase
MTDTERARTAPGRIRVRGLRVAALLVALAAIAAALGNALPRPAASSSARSAAPPIDARHDARRALHIGARDEADGAVPDGTTVYDNAVPGVAKLDPALLTALRSAAAEAADDGIRFVVNSGWRSPAYQEQLLRDAVRRYGSEAAAARWVATPRTSAHVSGAAVDVGPADADGWLSEHGAAYGLCRVYDNEPWHYELRPDAIDRGCPVPYPDPTHDPRLR